MQKHKERNVQLVSSMYFYIKKSIIVETTHCLKQKCTQLGSKIKRPLNRKSKNDGTLNERQDSLNRLFNLSLTSNKKCIYTFPVLRIGF